MPTAVHTPDGPDELLTASEIAEMARVDPATVLRWAKDGLLPVAVRTPGGRRRFRRSDVERILQPDTAEQAS